MAVRFIKNLKGRDSGTAARKTYSFFRSQIEEKTIEYLSL